MSRVPSSNSQRLAVHASISVRLQIDSTEHFADAVADRYNFTDTLPISIIAVGGLPNDETAELFFDGYDAALTGGILRL